MNRDRESLSKDFDKDFNAVSFVREQLEQY